ncbi:MAG: hypothetical protein AAF317_10205, partial [Pseudomonadota bacterium]
DPHLVPANLGIAPSVQLLSLISSNRPARGAAIHNFCRYRSWSGKVFEHLQDPAMDGVSKEIAPVGQQERVC